MYTNIIFSIFGNDKRQLTIAESLAAKGHTVRLCCIDTITDDMSRFKVFLDWRQAITGCDVAILPLPVSRDGLTLSYTSETVYLKEIMTLASKSGCKYVLGGLFPSTVSENSWENINLIDYYKSEALQLKNALPSAEGALMIAMEHTDKVIEGMQVIIGGFGRIGKRLSDILMKLGAHVTVAARRDESLCEAAMCGYKAVRIENGELSIEALQERYDVIFNTVPHLIFSKKFIDKIECNPIYIEIASAPYGIDLCAAREKGIEVIFAPSIPGKYAPETAGKYIFETITDILEERGVSL